MKLQKRLSRYVGKKEYVKWIITIPPEIIEKLTWKAGEDLKSEIHSNKLIISKQEKED